MWVLIDWNTIPRPTAAGVYETAVQCEDAIAWLLALTDGLANPACPFITALP